MASHKPCFPLRNGIVQVYTSTPRRGHYRGSSEKGCRHPFGDKDATVGYLCRGDIGAILWGALGRQHPVFAAVVFEDASADQLGVLGDH